MITGKGESDAYTSNSSRKTRVTSLSFRMSRAASKAVRKVVGSEQEVAKQLCTLIEHLSNEAIEARGRFTVGLSGRSRDECLLSPGCFLVAVI